MVAWSTSLTVYSSTSLLVDQRRKRIDVGALQLRETPVEKDLAGQLMMRGQLLDIMATIRQRTIAEFLLAEAKAKRDNAALHRKIVHQTPEPGHRSHSLNECSPLPRAGEGTGERA